MNSPLSLIVWIGKTIGKRFVSIFDNRATASKVTIICISALLLTGATVNSKSVQAFAAEVEGIKKAIYILQTAYSLARAFGKKRDRRRGRNLVAMPVPLEAVGTTGAQKDVQCMVNQINNRVSSNTKGWLGRKFFKGETKKVVLKSGTLPPGRYGQAKTSEGVDAVAEITLDLEQIRNAPTTDSYELDVATTVFHELWHVANPKDESHKGGVAQFPEDDPRYWKGTFATTQQLAWSKIFGQPHPNWKIAHGNPRKKGVLIGPGYYDSCFYKMPANKKRMHGR